ncbi:hypothetical protein ACRASX_15390 [Flavobacterium sp. TMP13]
MEQEDKSLIDGKIDELKFDIEKLNEQKFVNLLIEIIVSITLNELHEKSD